MLETPMHAFHLDHGAKMVDFAGWHMPMVYAGIHEEHHQVRTSGGVFDVSHMGRVRVRGLHARRLLERLCTRRISDMAEGQCRYSLVCNEQGGVKDDVLVYRMDSDEFIVVVNASNREKLLAHFEEVKGDLNCRIKDETLDTAMVAIQGPKVMDLVSKVSKEIPSLKRFRFTVKNVLVMKLIVSRTGYTGEDGVEVILPAKAVGMAMKMLMADVDPKDPDAILKPAGLGCRDTLRMEAGMPLYGHELNEDRNALATGMGFAFNLDKDEDERGEAYVGMEALKRTRDEGGPKEKLVGLKIEGRRTPRQDMPVLDGETPIGIVTSGCMSPTLGHPIAMAYVDASFEGERLLIDAGRTMLEATVTPLPFYRRSS